MLSTRWIPKSKRGRRVARLLRSFGYDIRNADVMGRYVCNLPMWSELTIEQRRKLFYVLDPDAAYNAEMSAIEAADIARRSPFEDDHRYADELEIEWLR